MSLSFPEDSPKAGAGKGRNAMGSGGGRVDVRQVITDRIIAMLAQGGNVFRARWTRAASRGMPRNGKTGAPYRGANVLLLWDAAIDPEGDWCKQCVQQRLADQNSQRRPPRLKQALPQTDQAAEIAHFWGRW
ncbi:ArdC-like ssDNA-binding domain-containing protein [Variovorax sp. RT4R15]|uniref:ArdC-like ssDNA-binding domain-containing protein n=1 Tax=Variovorax sp. RT4R15 TaxID=3443737 RepID=UPI003F468361